MPLFFRKKKPSDDSKKRLEYQLCLSKEAGADDILDISACELTEVSRPSQESLRNVFILHGNELKALLPKGCSITSLATLKVLDLHENHLTSLPEDIGQLKMLQVLNAEKNQIKVLPESIGDLHLLQTLNMKSNLLSELPSTLGGLSSLRTLDISENQVWELPMALAHIRTLECLTLDAAQMTFPPVSICSGGTEDIQRFLCAGIGVEYCPPSQYLLPVLENDRGLLEDDCVDGEQDAWQNKFQDYAKRKEQKQQEKLEFERRLEEEQREHAHLLHLNNFRKDDILQSVRQEQERLEQGVSQQQRALEAERLRLLGQLKLAENNLTCRIAHLLQENKRCVCVLLSHSLTHRIRLEQLTSITQEEANSLRKKEVLTVYHILTLTIHLLCSLESLDKKFDQVLSLQQLDKTKAIAHILQEEEMQKAAFQALQLQKDSMHGFIRSQIRLIEAELMQLTKLEVKRRNLDTENLQEILSEQRVALTDLLQQLLKQKDQREVELRHILAELEMKSESNQQNYWMIQYQRLLDAKPLSLRMQEAGVEQGLVSLLCKLSAEHYLPVIAHHRLTAEALRHMTTADLAKLGIREVGIQKALLSWCRTQEVSPAKGAETQVLPCLPGQAVAEVPSAPKLQDEAPGSSECVVCMEIQSQVVFLPCGHVCCCQTCSDVLQSCPLCRSHISQRVRIYHH
uniref:Leucine rich repeat and sterile alpha motif containing 1 n=1 Tax=Paramormyrops kingsleyae TaxID=1676925 RepID=A0A3B3R014_9TELE